MLKKIRLTLAIVFWVLITWLLVDFTGTAHAYLGWMAKMQFVPALLALNVGALLFVVTLTLLMGRIYCSVICPLGVMQDAIAWLRKKKNKYNYSPAKNTLRYTILVLACATLVLNIAWIAGLIFPSQPLWHPSTNSPTTALQPSPNTTAVTPSTRLTSGSRASQPSP